MKRNQEERECLSRLVAAVGLLTTGQGSTLFQLLVFLNRFIAMVGKRFYIDKEHITKV